MKDVSDIFETPIDRQTLVDLKFLELYCNCKSVAVLKTLDNAAERVGFDIRVVKPIRDSMFKSRNT